MSKTLGMMMVVTGLVVLSGCMRRALDARWLAAKSLG